MKKGLLYVFAMFFGIGVWGQDVIYWRTDNTSNSNGYWEYGSTCNSDGTDGQWYNTMSGGGNRKRPDCFATPNKLYFDGNGINTMKLNSSFDFELNWIIFTNNATDNRILNNDSGRTLYLKSNNGDPKIENQSNATHTFNVPIVLNNWAEFNPVNGGLTFSEGINMQNNKINVWGNNGHTLLIAGSLYGSGTFVINQNSFVKFTNNNTYSGSTTISNGTLSIGDGGTAGAVAGNIANNAALIFNRSNDYTYAGEISGTGTLNKKGAGKLTLSGNNTFSGTTTVEAGTLEITGSINCGQMTVATGATLIVNGNTVKMSSLVNNGTVIVKSGHTIEVTNAINNNGTITVEDKASLVQVNETDSNTGTNFIVKKTTGAYKNYDFFYWASPVADFVIENAFPIGSGNFPNFRYKYNPELFIDNNNGTSYPQTTSGGDGYNDLNGGDWTLLTNGTTIPNGIGFITMGKNSPTSFSAANFNIDQAAFDVTFTGKVNNGTIPVTVKKDASSTYDTWNSNLNLIGNPYPSAIDLHKLYIENSSILDGNFYFWQHDTPIAANAGPNAYDYNNSSYAAGVVTGTGTNPDSYTITAISNALYSGGAPGRYVASGQGFMAGLLESSGATATINFKNSMRVSGNNNAFLRIAANPSSNVDRLWLNLTNDQNIFSQIAVGFAGSTSDDLSQGDAARIDNGAATDFYSLIPNVNGQFAIQFLSNFNVDKMVPLGMGVQNSGNFSISLDHQDGIFTQGQAIYLEDTYQNIIHDFANGAYSFTQNAGANINDRFILRFTNSTAATPEEALAQLAVYPNPSNGVFNITNPTNEVLVVDIYNVVGKLIERKQVNNVLDLSNVAKGIYFAQISNQYGSITKKLIIE